MYRHSRDPPVLTHSFPTRRSSDLRQQVAEWIEAVELRWIEFERGGIAGDQRRRVVAGVAVRQAALEVHTGLRLQPAVEEIALKLQFLDPGLLACDRDVGIADADADAEQPVLVEKIGRAHVCTPVTNAHLVCR